jgi:hypothetical protein
VATGEGKVGSLVCRLFNDAVSTLIYIYIEREREREREKLRGLDMLHSIFSLETSWRFR